MHQEFFDILHKDHQEVEQMLGELEQETAGRQQLVEKLAAEVIPHMKGEEVGYYAMLLKDAASKDKATEATKEHMMAEQTLKTLMSTPTDSRQWMSVLGQLTEEIQHHVQEEETEVFPLSRKVLSEDQIHTAMTQFNEEKMRLKKEMKKMKVGT